MSEPVAFLYNERFQEYELSPSHPLKPIRLKLTYELLKDYGAFDKSQLAVFPGRLATDEELMLVHSAAYIDVVKRVGGTGSADTLAYSHGIGPGDNPPFKGMHEASSLIAGCSIAATEQVMDGKTKHSINISGGLHHALKDRASGFCIYNDAAVAIAHAIKAYGIKVAYIDIDAHHGDGVQWAFYDRDDVLTISLHESGQYLFPGTGFIDEVGIGKGEGYSVNVPLDPGTFDDLYLLAFDAIVPPLIKVFKPDLIVSQNGCDTHYTDPLAELSLTTNAYEQLYSRIHELAHEVCEGRLVALGGGGYQAYQVVPRAWALLSAELADFTLDDAVPQQWQEFCSAKAHSRCPDKLRDKAAAPSVFTDSIEQRTKDTIANVKKRVFPYFGL
ncbi:MAG: acetoin utilization protein AcuC [Firmicutes bacterium]|nr:acetoin utilization protein AcuC [Bacillota bacterium]